jgi:hypothetical protein
VEGGGRVLGHEPMPGQGPRQAPAVLPATVVAAHLRSCAAELAALAAPAPDPRIGSPSEFAEVIGLLLVGQRDISHALALLAGRVRDGQESGALSAVPSPDLDVLAEVLRVAAGAVGHATDALAESVPSLGVLVDSAGEDSRL